MLIRLNEFLLQVVVCVLFCTLNLTATLDTINTNSNSQNVTSIRLPTVVQPLRYKLHITSRIHDNVSVFSGSVVIDIVVGEPTNVIVVHAKLLQDFVIYLTDVRRDRRYDNLKYSYEADTNFLRISSPKRLLAGERYSLKILYNGYIQEDSYGIYKDTFKDDANRTIPLAITQFEPTSARLAFPCFDEPSFKAQFIISITHSSYYSALSNMPIDGQPSFHGEMTTTTFRETRAMPTYLIGFVISNYHHISQFVNGLEHRVFFPSSAKDFGARALTNSIQTVAAFEKYLGIEYPLPKLDHIHFKKTALNCMEHWGLITYDVDNFLTTIEDRESTVSRIVLQNFAISQQWFGNMVTLKWWSSAWLKAGLSTHLSYTITDLVYPTWNMTEYFLATEADQLYRKSITTPLFHSVETDKEIQDNSDDVLFQMGACVIKMFEHAIGHDTFTKGLKIYLNRFKYSVADEDDFSGALQTAIDEDNLLTFLNGKSVVNIMHSWTHNHGIPTIKVTRNYTTGVFTIEQQPNSNNTDEKWWIPLNFASASNPNFGRTTTDYIMPPQQQVTIDPEDINVSLMNKDWLIVNKQQTGLFHVIYDDHNLELIAEALNKHHTKIHKFNRALLFRDLKGILDTELGAIEPLLLSLQYLKFEQSSLPWYEAAGLINELWSRLQGGKAFDLFKAFIRDIVGDFYHRFFALPLYQLSFSDSVAKKLIFKLACAVELDECLAHARHITKEYLLYDWPIDEALRVFTLCKAMQSAPLEEFQEILTQIVYPRIKSKSKAQFLSSLECITSEENLKFILQFVNDGDKNFMKQLIEDHVRKDNPLFHKIMVQDLREKTMQLASAMDRISEQMSRPKRSLDADILLQLKKRENFQRKYEERIYAWLKNYQVQERPPIEF